MPLSLLVHRCLYWFGDRWLSDADNLRCESPRSELLTQNYIECRCSLLGNFSARAELSTSYGWFWPAPTSCGLVIVSWLHPASCHLQCCAVPRRCLYADYNTCPRSEGVCVLCASPFTLLSDMPVCSGFAFSDVRTASYSVGLPSLQLVLIAAFILHLFFYDRLTSATILIVNLFVAVFLLQVRRRGVCGPLLSRSCNTLNPLYVCVCVAMCLASCIHGE